MDKTGASRRGGEMVELRDRDTIITSVPVSDGGAGAAAMVILALVLAAVIGYCIYAFGGTNSSTIIERDNSTNTIQQPAAAPAPAPAAPAPAMPSGADSSN
jgi:hypothetical protein